MGDEQQTPAEPSFKDKLAMDAKSLWNEHKLFFIIFGALILIVKFRDILIDILVSSANREMTDAKKQDASLAADENKANAQADELVKKAAEEPAKEKPVDDDWYKK